MSSVLGSEKIKYFFISSMEKCESGDALIESSKLEDDEDIEKASKIKEYRSRRYSSSFVFYMSVSLYLNLNALFVFISFKV